jgi:diacylglycerol kinase family enzyme
MVKPETAPAQLGLIVNPKSSFPGKVERYSDAIQEAVDCEVVMIETQPPDETDNVRLVEGVLKENPGIKRLGVCGGDGSWNTAGNGVIASGRDDISMFIAPCGNADDTATSLYGKGGLEDPQDLIDLIRHGIPTPLPGIKVEDDGRTRHAFSYWGMGLSGQAAVEMNRRGYRDVKEGRNPLVNRLTDAMKVVPFLLPTEGNIYSYNGHGSQREVRELLISSASLFAREFVIDVDSWGEEVVVNEFGPEEFVRGLLSRLAKERYRPELTAMLAGASFMPDAFRSALARRPQTPGIKGQPFSSLSMEMKQDTPVQYDGEPDIALAGSNIDISVVPAAISVLKPRHLQPV